MSPRTPRSQCKSKTSFEDLTSTSLHNISSSQPIIIKPSPRIQQHSKLRQSIELGQIMQTKNQTMFIKKNNLIKSMDDRHLMKEMSKIKNHRYLSLLSQKPGNKNLIESNFKKHKEPLFPMTFCSHSTHDFESVSRMKSKSNEKLKFPNCPKLPYLTKKSCNEVE